MNRQQRRAMRRSDPIVQKSTVYKCTRCGQKCLHIEVWDDPSDSATGLPDSMTRCSDCGGELVRDEQR